MYRSARTPRSSPAFLCAPLNADLIAIGMKVPRIARVVHHRPGRRAARRLQTHHRRPRIRPIQRRVRPAIHFQAGQPVVDETVPKSNVPPTSFAGIPSISTSFAVEFPPRTNSEVTPPACPVCTTSTPGDWRSASTTPTVVASSLSRNQRHRRAGLLHRRRQAGRRHRHLLMHRAGFQHHVLRHLVGRRRRRSPGRSPDRTPPPRSAAQTGPPRSTGSRRSRPRPAMPIATGFGP